MSEESKKYPESRVVTVARAADPLSDQQIEKITNLANQSAQEPKENDSSIIQIHPIDIIKLPPGFLDPPSDWWLQLRWKRTSYWFYEEILFETFVTTTENPDSARIKVANLRLLYSYDGEHIEEKNGADVDYVSKPITNYNMGKSKCKARAIAIDFIGRSASVADPVTFPS